MSITVLPSPNAEIDASAIDILEECLALAKAGKIRGITVVADLGDQGGMLHRRSGVESAWRHLGQLHHAAWVLTQELEAQKCDKV
jgi:hypothetical protein